jgi:hypothetical protein
MMHHFHVSPEGVGLLCPCCTEEDTEAEKLKGFSGVVVLSEP